MHSWIPNCVLPTPGTPQNSVWDSQEDIQNTQRIKLRAVWVKEGNKQEEKERK